VHTLPLPRLGARSAMVLFAIVVAALALFLPHDASSLPTFGLGLIGFGGMIFDELTEFADATALSTAGTGRALVGDVIPLGVARDLGAAEPLYLVIQVDTTVTSGGAATVSFELSSDAQAAIAVDGTETIHFATKAFSLAELVAGKTLAVIALPMEGVVYETFLGIVQNVGAFALTAGKINAFLTSNPAKYKAYPDAI
jgi:hypothetical protein